MTSCVQSHLDCVRHMRFSALAALLTELLLLCASHYFLGLALSMLIYLYRVRAILSYSPAIGIMDKQKDK